jgi:hypothetical protein
VKSPYPVRQVREHGGRRERRRQCGALATRELLTWGPAS